MSAAVMYGIRLKVPKVPSALLEEYFEQFSDVEWNWVGGDADCGERALDKTLGKDHGLDLQHFQGGDNEDSEEVFILGHKESTVAVDIPSFGLDVKSIDFANKVPPGQFDEKVIQKVLNGLKLEAEEENTRPQWMLIGSHCYSY